MSRSTSIFRVTSLLAVVCGTVFLFSSILPTAVSAAASPSEPNSYTVINNGWVINEFHADPASDLSGDANGDGIRDAQQDEFIELFNNTGSTADISGWSLADEYEMKHTFPPGSIVPDQCAIVIFGGGSPTGTFGFAAVQVASSGSLGLDNTGDTITFSDGPLTIQSMVYGFEGNEDQSLTRNPDISGTFAGHLTVSDSRFSPGTQVDGSSFWGCDLPPVLLQKQPADGAAGVTINSDIKLTFSEAVTFSEPWYEIACTQSGSHTAVLSGGGTSFTLTPHSLFAYEELCQVTLFGAGISDLDGQPQPMQENAQWQFTTETKPDSAPLVVDSFPAGGAAGVARTATFAITFSEPVAVSETAVDLACSHSGIVTLALSGGPTLFQVDPDIELEMGELCTLTVAAAGVTDLDLNDPPDQMPAYWQISFNIEAADFLLINEVDSETLGHDNAEFIELFDGGRGGTRLDGLSLVLFNGHDDSAYASFDLAGQQTDDNGYFLLASSSVAGVDLVMDDSLLQNGADAVALYQARSAQFPVGTAVTVNNLIDALVYDTNQADDAGLLTLLHEGEEQVNEDGRNLDDFHSLQRCPDGSGGQRRTGTVWPDLPTPKTSNNCIKDEAPRIAATTPPDGAASVLLNSALSVTFSEEVVVNGEWFDIYCEHSGSHEAASSGGGLEYSLQPTEPFFYGEQCRVTIFSELVRDLDAADPPDHLAADYVWSFSMLPARHMLINEVDADTPGADTAEFIELYDGGRGETLLEGLVLVLFNGADDLSYRALDLSGRQTDAQGRFVIGSTAVPGVDLLLPDGIIQNGADAVALYAGSGEDFPNGSTVTTDNLLDAVVYGTVDEADGELMALLAGGEQQLDEAGRGNAVGDSNQRCADGAGGQRRSAAFVQNLATPGEANRCTFDEAPALLSTTPAAGDSEVALDSAITINFSEAVDLEENWFLFECGRSGRPAVTIRHSEDQVVLKPEHDLAQNDSCTVTVLGARIHDSDLDDPPDTLAADYSWSFTTLSVPVATHMLINEVDAATMGADTAEFVELYDGGEGNTALDGLVVVLFNGSDDLSNKAIDLDGYKTNGQGYFVVGNAAVPGADHLLNNGTLQNGPDAVALYAGNAADFPNGTAVSTAGVLDALVYSTGDESAPGLMPLLHAGEPIANENGRDAGDVHANQRCPNGAGGQRRSSSFLQNTPTPKAANYCEIDSPPAVTGHAPGSGQNGVAKDSQISISFDEAVLLGAGSVRLQCAGSGDHELAVSGGPQSFSLKPLNPLSAGESCTVTLFGDKVSDLDNNDPPDTLSGDYSWSFTTAAVPVARHVLINEVDADSPGADKAEFIELYDGGSGSTALDGLEIVLFNGTGDRAYRHINLAGFRTKVDGYFVIGGSAVPGVDLPIADGVIQNGPDAVALYVSDELNHSKPDEKGLLDALVYHTNDEEDAGLNFLLLKDEPQINEGQWREPALDSNQRCPNGQGGQRVTSGYMQNQPTPGTANNCTVDKPPQIVQVFPADGTLDVPLNSSLAVHFDEAVQVGKGWISLSCEQAGVVELATTGGPVQYDIQPTALKPLDHCKVTVDGEKVQDLDGHVDTLAGDYGWQFSTAKPQTALSAGFTSSSPVTIGEPLRFTNTCHGPQPLSYEWDFGDGSPVVSEVNPVHLYSAVGTFTVTLTVKTSGGKTAATSASVEILPLRIYLPLATSADS